MADLDLSRGLHDLSLAPRLDGPAAPLPVVAARVRRARAVRAAATGTLTVAVLAGIGVAAWAGTPWGDPVPPAVVPTPSPVPTAEPTVSPSPERTPTPTPTPTRTPAAEPVAPPATPLGITVEGDLVRLDPATGAVVDVVRSGLDSRRATLAVDHVGGRAFVGQISDDGSRSILEVSLADGSSRVVTEGRHPAVSPDGAYLAYIGLVPDPPTQTADGVALGPDVEGLVVLDLTTGERRWVVDEACTDCDRVLRDPVWSTDGRSVLLVTGWSDGYFENQVAVVDVPSGAPSLMRSARTLGPDDGRPYAGWNTAARLHDGRLVVGGWAEPPGAPADYDPYVDQLEPVHFVAVVDEVTGQVVERLDTPGTSPMRVAASPDGTTVLLTTMEHDPVVPGAGTWTLSSWTVGAASVEPLDTPLVAVDW